jgi:uncharacterized membrane protein
MAKKAKVSKKASKKGSANLSFLTDIVARVLFAIPFFMFGVNHFVYGPKMAYLVPSYVPGGVFWVYFTGVALIAAAVSIVTKIQGKLAMYLLAVLLLAFVLTLHFPGMSSANVDVKTMSMMALLKDLGLMGGALLLAGIFEKK